jgi:hypothetical protein
MIINRVLPEAILVFFFFLTIQLGFAQDILKVEPLSSSKYIEFSPSISGNGKIMVFQRLVKDQWRFYESRLSENGSWNEPQPVESLNTQFGYLSGPCLSYDGNQLYFTAYQETELVNSEDIFMSERVNGIWQEAHNLGKPVNSFRFEGYPSISADGNTIIFMRENTDYDFDKENKVHCFKLFIAHKDKVGAWMEPEEIPYPVNFNCERSPKILYDNHTLLFSSLRSGGKGKFDIYSSKVDQNGIWSEPIPLHYLNTSENDQSPCLAGDGKSFYFYSDGDIFQVNIPEDQREYDLIEVRGNVIDAIYRVGLSVNLQILDPYNQEVEAFLDNTESDGKFNVNLLKGRIYYLDIIQDNNYTYSFPLDLTNLRGKKFHEAEFELFSNLNLKMEVVDKNTTLPIDPSLKIRIQLDKTPLKDTYMMRFFVKNFKEESSILKLEEVRKNPDFKRRVELTPL